MLALLLEKNDVIDSSCFAPSPRGVPYTKENIMGRLKMRDFMDALRPGEVDAGGSYIKLKKALNRDCCCSF